MLIMLLVLDEHTCSLYRLFFKKSRWCLNSSACCDNPNACDASVIISVNDTMTGLVLYHVKVVQLS